LGGVEAYIPIQTVVAFSTNDVWAASGVELVHWYGSTWTSKAFFMVDVPFDGQVLKMWGTSGNNLYCVGRTGAIYHYNGNTWTKIESGTTLGIQDIYGSLNTKTDKHEVLAVASDIDQNNGKKIIKIDGEKIDYIQDDALGWSIRGIWFKPNMKYYIVGAGIFRKNLLYDQNPWVMYPIGQVASSYSEAIRGNDINDVVTVGDFGEIVHYNGCTWKNYSDLTGFYGIYCSVAMRGNIIVAVGYNSTRAFIAMGKR
jgi:hypothetical protein